MTHLSHEQLQYRQSTYLLDLAHRVVVVVAAELDDLGEHRALDVRQRDLLHLVVILFICKLHNKDQAVSPDYNYYTDTQTTTNATWTYTHTHKLPPCPGNAIHATETGSDTVWPFLHSIKYIYMFFARTGDECLDELAHGGDAARDLEAVAVHGDQVDLARVLLLARGVLGRGGVGHRVSLMCGCLSCVYGILDSANGIDGRGEGENEPAGFESAICSVNISISV